MYLLKIFVKIPGESGEATKSFKTKEAAEKSANSFLAKHRNSISKITINGKQFYPKNR